MPAINVVLFETEDGSCPILQWLDRLPERVSAKCLVKIERLAELGYELRRPEADLLRDGIYELRTKLGTIRYRMLYFFHGNTAAVLSHGIIKPGGAVDPKEINLAIARAKQFKKNPAKHTHHEEADDE